MTSTEHAKPTGRLQRFASQLATCALAAALLALPGCGAPQVQLSPQEEAAIGLQRRLDRALDRAAAEVADVGTFATLVRHNPAPCDCPVWEAQLGGHWTRVALVPAREARTAVDTFLTSSRPETGVPARIAVTREGVAGDSGWVFPVAELVAVGMDDESGDPDR